MKIRYNFTVILKKGNKLETKVFKKANTYSVVQGKFFFISLVGKMSDEQSGDFGRYVNNFVWIPIKDIIKIEAEVIKIFENRVEKNKFIKEEIMGLKPLKS